MRRNRIAVLALQGAFIEHEQMLQGLGVETFEVRQSLQHLLMLDERPLKGKYSDSMSSHVSKL